MELHSRKPLVVGNWKMNHSVTDAIKWVTQLENIIGEVPLSVDAVIAPPFTSLYSVSVAIQETSLKLAAQNCHWEEEGAFTGEISAPFLKDLGCEYVILGHSERRTLFGETHEMINKKIHAALNSEITPIFCIGETLEERKAEKTHAVLETQLRKGFSEIGMSDLESFVVAYEPVWAVGTGVVANAEQISEVHALIRGFLAKLYDAPTANRIRILYGGSVKTDNFESILKIHHVDGLLIGGASLDALQFSQIIRYPSSNYPN